MIEISIHDLLVGDILLFSQGEMMPVDALLISGNNIQVDESSMTGESDTITKAPLNSQNEENHDPFLISGSKVLEGSGRCIVIAVGEKSSMGKIFEAIGQETEITPLQRKLQLLVQQIGRIGISAAIVSMIAILVSLVLQYYLKNKPFFDSSFMSELLNILIIGITITVVVVPEGLPLAVTLSLAFSVGKMEQLNNLVKRLESCETMGNANNILTDKTGTLTKNQMELIAICTEGKIYYNLDYQKSDISKNTLDILCTSICENSTAFLEIDPITKLDVKKIGNSTECALLRFACYFGYSYQKNRIVENQILLYPFNSVRKRMTKVIKLNDNIYRIFFKGAPDYIKKEVTSVLINDGKGTFKGSHAEVINKAINEFSANALRSVMLAYKDISAESFDKLKNECKDDLDKIENALFSDLIFIALCGIADPVRNDVAEAVRKCHNAGVKVRMVTGDSLQTARSIALKLGIVNENEIDEKDQNYKKYAIMTGNEFFNMIGGIEEKNDPNYALKKIYEIRDPNKFKEIVSQLKVLARSLPEHKFALVTGLKQDKDNVVAVTGDGTNDAMALKNADIGFAMGITGTEIAKEAAGIILLDDNFSSIIVALLWGRNILLSIRKFVQFQFTVNIVAVYTVLIGSIFLSESPLTSVQMLWVNLIMDTLGALALATEPPSNALLKEKPSLKTESIITKMMWKNIISQAFFQIIIMSILIFFPNLIFNLKIRDHSELWTKENGIHQTVIFNTFVFLQLFNEINSRKIGKEDVNPFKNILYNIYFILIISITLTIQLFIISFGGYALKCSPLSLNNHLICIGLASLSLIVGILTKILPDYIFFCYFNERKVKYEEVNSSYLTVLSLK